VIGKTDADMLPSHEAAPIMAIKRSVLETGIGTQAEIQLTLGGLLNYFLLTVEPLYDTEGEIMGITCAAFNITERKEAEKRLKESEERFRNMADMAPVLIWVSGTDSLCNFFNQPWLDFTGRTLEQELGNGWVEGVHPDDMQYCLDIYLSAFEARQPFNMEYRLRRFDGEYRWMLDSAVPRIMPDGTFAGFIGSCLDITERKKYEEQLRRSERLKQEIFEGSADALFLINARTNCIEDYNQQAVNLFGYKDKQELIGRQVHALHKQTFTKGQIRRILREIQDNHYWTSEVEYVSKTGREFWGNAAITLIQVDGSAYFLVRVRDITERKKAEEEIARSQQQLLIEKQRTEKALDIIAKDNLRKTKELEEARALQLSMLPQFPPELKDLDIAMYMKTCVEVGGDYYDYKVDEEGT
jgi:PAS domain S-box-containing protein